MKSLITLPFLLLSLIPSFNLASENTLKKDDIFYLGITDDKSCFTARFKILDNEKTSTGEEGMFLLCETLVSDNGKALKFRTEKKPTSNMYQGSNAKKWCESFYDTHFSDEEKEWIIPTYKSDESFSIHAPFGVEKGPYVDFKPEENALDGDHLFFLSAEEICAEKYGLAKEEDRIAPYHKESEGYWLRSPHIDTFPNDVGFIFFNGWLMDFIQNSDNVFLTGGTYARPGLNIKKPSAEDIVSIGDNQYCLTIDKDKYQASEPPKFKVKNPLPMTILVLVLTLSLLGFLFIGLPIIIVKTIKKKKQKALAENENN